MKLRFRLWSPSFSSILLVVLSAAAPFHARATSIVAYVSPSEVLIAADSKVYGTDMKRTVFFEECKIRLAGKFVYASAGLAVYPKLRFNVWEIVSKALQDKRTLREATLASTDALKAAVVPVLEKMKRDEPDMFKAQILKGDGEFLQIIFAGLEGGKPVMYARGLQVVFDSNQKILIRVNNASCDENCVEGETNWFFLGEADAIDRFMKHNEGKITFNDVAEAIKYLVQLEIDDPEASKKVGAPIDVIRVSARGIEWVQKKRSCDETRARLFTLETPPRGPRGRRLHDSPIL